MKKIFVKSVNWIGDAVMVTPALRALRRAFPESHVTVLSRPWMADVFEANPDIDRLWVANENASLRVFREIAKRIRDERFDLGISLPNSFGAALLLWLGSIPRRLGYARDGRSFLLTDKVTTDEDILNRHQVEYYLNLLRAFGDVDQAERQLVVPEAPGTNERVREMLSRFGLLQAYEEGRPLVALNPGAAYGGAKQWFPERYAEISDRIVEEYGAVPLTAGSKGELSLAQRVADAAKHPISILNGCVPIRELIALCDYLSLLVTNDSGVMHVAAARKVPIVAIFGPTNSITTAPYSSNAIVVRQENPCAENPCFRRECPRQHKCMDLVTVDDVMEAVRQLMERSAHVASA